MTDWSKLLALAEAVEKLTGPDRETDIRIKAAIYGGEALVSPINGEWCVYRSGTTDPRAGKTLERVHGVSHEVWKLDRYTASLDAATTLVPEEYDWAVFRTNGGLTFHAWCGSRDNEFGETPALALCAAALRAQAEAVS